VGHQLIRLEQRRSGSRKLLDTTLAELEEGGSDPEAERLARELFNTRRELLGRLIQLHGRYSSQLVELETVKRNFLDEIGRVTDFLYERLLWVRSVPRPIIPRPADLGEALRWLTAPSNWGEVFRAAGRSIGERTSLVVAGLLAFGLLLGLRRRFHHRLRGAAEIVREPDNDSFTPTLGALLYTLLLAAPLPIALTVGGRLVLRPDAPSFVYSAGSALLYLAAIAGLLELSRQFLARDGLAEAQFGWPPDTVRRIRRGLRPSEAVFLPLIYVAILFGMQGMHLDSPERYLGYNNSLGRLAFVVALTFLGFTLLGLFRPRARGAGEAPGTPAPRLHKVYVFAYPAILVATLVPAGLAVLGYYLTGYLLAYQMLRTLWLLGILLILHGVMVRWRIASRRRARAGATGAVAAGLDGAELQTRQMNRFLIVLIAAVGLYAIWSEAVPALQALKRVQVWPRIEIHESADVEFRAPKAKDGETPEPAEGETGGSPKPAVPLLSIPGAGDADGTPSGVPGVTLWAVLQSLLAVIITVALVKNLPGVLELGLRKRTHLDSGARIALGTLVRYTILILGFSAAFGLLGISWSKIQWLAAALTFGLGFGLQEIVANFVSGLILLVERPIRVGDAVTVGNLQGIVSRIQIRATTITLWDRSEMIVPNKEFITTKLVNWTLTDSRRRIDIPVRVAYGADLEKIKETLVEAAREHPNVFDDPAPHVLLIEFGDDAMRFELRFFVEFGEGLSTRDQVQMAIDRAFRERGIEFAIPKLDLRLPGRTGTQDVSRREEPPSEPTD
jgi:potassium efflux system protein